MSTTTPTTTFEYSLIPNFESSVSSALFVLILFVLYLTFVTYLATYDLAYTPNPNMFWNFLFDNYDGLSKFQEYITESCKEVNIPKPITTGASGFTNPKEKESFDLYQNANNTNNTINTINTNSTKLTDMLHVLPSSINRLYSTIQAFYQRMLRKVYVKGNKIHIYR